MKIGILKEGRTPPDARVPLTPQQCAFIKNAYHIEIVVQHSPIRCYADEEYAAANIPLVHDLSDCDILLGIKEVPIAQLIPNKTYFFFSHTIKKQTHNRLLLQNILQKNIQLIDYETLTNEKGERLIAFGHFAGMVGAHNGVVGYGLRTQKYELPRLKDFHDYAEAVDFYRNLQLPAMKIVVTGTGRVAQGAVQVLRDMGVKEVSPIDFLEKRMRKAVFTQLSSQHYVRRKGGGLFDKPHFYRRPHLYESTFSPYWKTADVFINGIFWENDAPAFFTLNDLYDKTFRIQIIADVTCDIAPVASIPCTLRASTIAEPFFGFDRKKHIETAPFQKNTIDMMTIDNLPSELPRDASSYFGDRFLQRILPELSKKSSRILDRATITKNGQLTDRYMYLTDFVSGMERMLMPFF
jgi:saccharopine dehydrogenase (NAD+, L-lysine forming)